MNDDERYRILKQYRRIAVVGLSPKPDRASHSVSAYMARHGYDITPVNPGHAEILGRKCYKSLLDVPEPLEIVNIFRNPADVPPVVDQAIERGAKVIWMQLGIVNEEAAARARQAGLEVIMDSCIKIDHAMALHSGALS